MGKKQHIDDVQPKTVDEHFVALMEHTGKIDSKFVPVTKDDLPEWFDEKLFKAGQSYYMDNMLSMGLASLTGVLAIISVPSILELLIFTKQSGSECAAFRRYSQTMLLVRDIARTNVLDTNSKVYKALNVIRWRHATSHSKHQKEGFNGIFERDLAITQFGFIGYVLLNPKTLGFSNNAEGRIGFIHYWRVLGHLLGIPDRINICRKTDRETSELCRRIGFEVLAKYLEPEPENFIYMGTTLVDGFWHVDATANAGTLLDLTYKMTGLKYKKPLNWVSLINKMYGSGIVMLLNTPYIGAVVRTFFNYILNINAWILENYPIRAWMAFGKKKATICLYPKIC